MSYCIYLRKSRKDVEAEAKGEGETLARHEAALLGLAEKMKIPIDTVYREIVSGETIAARPVMQQLLSEVESGRWNGVLVMEVERLARGDTIDQGLVAQAFKWSDTKIITPMKTYDPNDEFDEEYFEFGLFMSRREYKTINRRLQRGREASAREGKFVGSIAPYGYERVKIPNEKGYTLKIVPENADIVRLIFKWYVEGSENESGETERIGFQKIAHKLNDMKVPAVRHDYWQKETIKDILTNPAYCGRIRWGYRKVNKKVVAGQKILSRPINYNDDCIVVKGLHEGIVSEEMFDKAQEIITDNPAPPTGYKSEVKSPLAGIIVCGKCGRKMVFRKAPNEKKKPYLVCHARACDQVSAPYHLVEKKVLQSLQLLLDRYELEQKANAKKSRGEFISNNKKLLLKTNAEYDKAKNQLSKVQDLLEQGVYSIEEYTERANLLKVKIAELKQSIENISSSIDRAETLRIKKEKAIPKIRNAISTYSTLSTAKAKNDLLKSVIEKIIYTKEKSGIYKGNSADDFDLFLYPRID